MKAAAGQLRHIAITGGIGAGKSLLAGWLRQSGHRVLDADLIGRQVVEEEKDLRLSLAGAFGAGILDAQGVLDRAALGRASFASASALARLNDLVFPYLEARLSESLAHAHGLCFVDAALIFEWGMAGRFDEVWVVRAADERRLARAGLRLGRDEGELAQRLALQLPQAEKVRRAHRVLDNDGPPLSLWEQADALLLELRLPRLTAATRPGNTMS